MNEFSAIRAWSLGVRFLAARPGQHAILLIGLGLIIPFAIQLTAQYALTGAILGRASPPPDAGLAYSLIPLIAIAFQAGACFASWRLGIGEGETLGSALRYGLIAGVIAVVVAILLGALAGLAASQAGSPAIGLFVLLFTLAPIVLMLALFGTMAAALIGAGVAAMMAIAMITSVATGNMGMAATMVGGSGFVVVLLLVLSVLMIWLAARFSCATAIMADAKSYNPISAARASWELTWDEQWRIMLYLAVLGIILLVLLVAGLAAIGAGAATLQASTSVMAQGVGLVFLLGFALLMIFLAVMVPAGIYRQMIGERAPVEVFA